ncbi:MAG TPA: lycopene cyclase domain-containing protein [Actinocatenispora sp.]
MSSWQYVAALGICVAVTLPLELVLGARVYRRPRALLLTVLPVVVAFGAWDLVGFHHGDWWYSTHRTLRVTVLTLPVEEWLFLLVIPVCALLTYEALGRARRRRDR